MNNKPLNIYKPKKGSEYYIGMALFLGFIFLPFYLLKDEFNLQYPDFVKIIIVAFFGLFGVFGLYNFSSKKIICVFEDYIIISFGIFSKKIKIRKSDLISWCELNKPVKETPRTLLYIFIKGKKFGFYSTDYEKYNDLKKDLTTNINLNDTFEYISSRKRLWKIGILFIVSGLIFLYFTNKNYLKLDYIVDTSNYIKIEQIVTSEIKFKQGDYAKQHLDLNFKGYPEFRFNVNENIFDLDKSDEFIAKVKTGDKLNFFILTEEYKKKLSHEQELNFTDKYVNYYRIEVFGLSKGENTFLNLEDCIIEVKSDKELLILIFLISGLILFISGIIAIVKTNKRQC